MPVPEPVKPFSIATNERLFIAGKTGSGKTYLMRWLIRSLTRLVVLDGKGSLFNWGLDDWENTGARARLLSGDPGRLRVPPPHRADATSYFQNIMGLLYEVGNLTIYIDELYAVVDPGSKPTPEFNALYTRGREFGIGVWSGTQRPVFVPLVAISEAEAFICFRLNLIEDRQRMAGYMTNAVIASIKDPHGFYYMRADEEKPAYHSGLNLVRKEN
jgi:hypothetical protein